MHFEWPACLRPSRGGDPFWQKCTSAPPSPLPPKVQKALLSPMETATNVLPAALLLASWLFLLVSGCFFGCLWYFLTSPIILPNHRIPPIKHALKAFAIFLFFVAIFFIYVKLPKCYNCRGRLRSGLAPATL